MSISNDTQKFEYHYEYNFEYHLQMSGISGINVDTQNIEYNFEYRFAPGKLGTKKARKNALLGEA